MNPAAENLLRDCSLLLIGHDGRLSATDRTLRGHIKRCVRAMREDRYEEPLTPVSLHTERFGTCVLHAHHFPEVRDHDFPEAVWSDPVVGGFVISGAFGLEKSMSHRSLAKCLGASTAEARLAQAVMEGLALYDYADENGLSRHTVRNQMRALLQKTGTRNQSDFVRHLFRLTSPFGHYDA